MRAFGQIGRIFLGFAVAAAVLAAISAIAGANVVLLVAGIMLVTFGILGGVFTVVQLKLFGRPAVLRRIETAGIPAIGVIEHVGGSSGRVNGNPILTITMSIGVGQTVVRSVVPVQHLGAVIVGSRLPVLTDPDGSYAAVIDWPRLTAGGS